MEWKVGDEFFVINGEPDGLDGIEGTFYKVTDILQPPEKEANTCETYSGRTYIWFQGYEGKLVKTVGKKKWYIGTDCIRLVTSLDKILR